MKKTTKKTSKKAATKAKPKSPVKKNPKKSAKVAGKTGAAPHRPAARTKPAGSGLPAIGTTAPLFSLPSDSGRDVALKSLIGAAPVVLFFYPRADTPGCTVEACGFRDAIASYRKLSVPVLGISPDPVKDVTRFARKFKLNFPLLADADNAVCRKYGVWVEKSMYGKKYMGAARTTFIIDTNGKIAHVFEKVDPEGHDKLVLDWLNAH